VNPTGRVVVVGDLMVVTLGRVDRMPRPGENVVLHEPSVHVSGVGANVALNLRALGLDVTLVSAVGQDALADRVLATLRDGGVDTDCVRPVAGAVTGSMVVMIEPDGERTMVGTRGASERFEFDPSAVLAEPAEPVPAWLHLSGYTLLESAMGERCEALVAAAAERGVPRSLDLEGGAAVRYPALLDRSLVFGNETECLACFGTTAPEELAALRAAADHPLIVKAGRRGCFVVDGGVAIHVPAPAGIEAGDSTGAGDAFDAAFIAARLQGASLEEACARANAAGAMAASASGPRPEGFAEPARYAFGNGARSP
jgi:ribokinase